VSYRHVQTSYLAFGSVTAVVVLLGVLMWADGVSVGARVLWLALLATLMPAMAVFSRLSVTVEAATVVVGFGWGWPKREIERSEVVDVRQVRNRWYHGWGIHGISGGWLYNVGGFDAVELELRSGTVFRIGTDEPERLAAALSIRRL